MARIDVSRIPNLRSSHFDQGTRTWLMFFKAVDAQDTGSAGRRKAVRFGPYILLSSILFFVHFRIWRDLPHAVRLCQIRVRVSYPSSLKHSTAVARRSHTDADQPDAANAFSNLLPGSLDWLSVEGDPNFDQTQTFTSLPLQDLLPAADIDSLSLGDSVPFNSQTAGQGNWSTVQSDSSVASAESNASSVSNGRRRRQRKKAAQPRIRRAGSEKRRYQCTFCTDAFKTKHDWQRHERALHLSLDQWQ